MIDPKTDAQWQEAVDAAEFCLALDSARQYGLIDGPKVDVVRAVGLLTLGRSRGIKPKPDTIERGLAQLDIAAPPSPPKPFKPIGQIKTKALPGTPGKVDVMRQRADAGLPLHDPEDGPREDLT